MRDRQDPRAGSFKDPVEPRPPASEVNVLPEVFQTFWGSRQMDPDHSAHVVGQPGQRGAARLPDVPKPCMSATRSEPSDVGKSQKAG